MDSTDNRDQVMNALGSVPGRNNFINEHELRQIVRGPKNNKAVGNDLNYIRATAAHDVNFPFRLYGYW